MKTIVSLFDEFKGKRLWFYVPKKVSRKFYKEIKSFHFDDGGKIRLISIGERMAVRPDKTVAYISCSSWMLSKASDEIVKIDYEKLIKGNDYIIE